MNTMSLVEDNEQQVIEKPGAQLAFLREKKGYTSEYVATKLHLRTRLIELLEADLYDQLPQPVFIKGYIRAYAKFLGISAEPFIAAFNDCCVEERKPERALWQTKRESNVHERAVRWITGLIVLSVTVAITLWWQKNNETKQDVSIKQETTKVGGAKKVTGDYLTQVSKIQSLFKAADPKEQSTPSAAATTTSSDQHALVEQSLPVTDNNSANVDAENVGG